MPGWKRSMESKKMKHNIAACWTAIILNPIWLIVDYFSAPKSIWFIAAVDLPITAIILLIVLTRKKLNLSADYIGVTTISLLSIAASYVSCHLELEQYQHLMISHTAILLVQGCWFLWK